MSPNNDVELGYFTQTRSTNIIWTLGCLFLSIQNFALWASLDTFGRASIRFAAVWYTIVQFGYIAYGIFILKRFMKRFGFGGIVTGTILSCQFSFIAAVLFYGLNAIQAVSVFGFLAAIFLGVAAIMQIIFKNDYLPDKTHENEQDHQEVPVSAFDVREDIN